MAPPSGNAGLDSWTVIRFGSPGRSVSVEGPRAHDASATAQNVATAGPRPRTMFAMMKAPEKRRRRGAGRTGRRGPVSKPPDALLPARARPTDMRTDDEIEALARSFEAATLPRPEWTHVAHLTVALWHLRRYPRDEATRR